MFLPIYALTSQQIMILISRYGLREFWIRQGDRANKRMNENKCEMLMIYDRGSICGIIIATTYVLDCITNAGGDS
jgi:hypothetical protein